MESSKPEQRQYIIRNAIFSFVFYVASGLTWYKFIPFTIPDVDSPWKRMVYTMRWQIFALLPVVFLIHKIATTRLHTKAIDPVKGNSEHVVNIYQKILQNTLEQFILHLIGVLSLSSYLTANTMKLVPFFVTSFVIGRVMFYLGYTSSSSLNRVFGMAVTISGNFMLIGFSIIFFLWNGPSFEL